MTAPALLVTGDAGVGKSRFVLESARWTGAPCTECRCSRHHETTSLYPFRPVLESACGIEDGDGAETRLHKLRATLRANDANGADLPFLTSALQIPGDYIAPPVDVDPSALRELALAAAARLVHARLGDVPCVLFVDDLHWADHSTLDLISALLGADRPGLLMMFAARSGFDGPWAPQLVERVQLDPLTSAELEEMAAQMPEAAALSEGEREELIDRCDGMPLFLEELVRTADAVERGTPLPRSVEYADYRIPAALRDPLLARLASPGVDLALAQVAACIGRDVEIELARRVAGLPVEEFDRRLQTLIDAGITEPDREGEVRFRHELIREVAYETQPWPARRERHGRIADELLQRVADPGLSDAGKAAFHLERARRYAEAIDALIGAARHHQGLGAHTEAMPALTDALSLLAHLPDDPERDQTELVIRELRSFSAVVTAGYAAREAAEDHGRCVELCEGFGLPPELLPSLIRSHSFYAFRGELTDAAHVAAAMTRVAATSGLDFPAEGIGDGLLAFFRGDFPTARRLYGAVIEHPWSRTKGRPPAEWPLPNDALGAVYGHLVLIHWISGERREAYAMAQRGLARAREVSFPYGPFTVAYVNSLLSLALRMEGDRKAAARCTGAIIEIGHRHGFAFWMTTAMLHRGLDGAHMGEDGAFEELQQAIAIWRNVIMGEAYSPWALTALAEAQVAAGRRDAALGSLDEALALAERTGSEFYAAETLRMRGELRRAAGDPRGIEDIEAALDKARRQGARIFELRAAMALAGATDESADARAAVRHALDGIAPDAGYPELGDARTLAL
jgi:tetratricopeptide (TPR) repeat protein